VGEDVRVGCENREYLALLGGRKAAEAAANTAELSARLAAFNAGRGSSERVERLLLLTGPPSADQHEVSDKGTINQRVALARRSTDVDRVYAPVPAPDVVLRSRTPAA